MVLFYPEVNERLYRQSVKLLKYLALSLVKRSRFESCSSMVSMTNNEADTGVKTLASGAHASVDHLQSVGFASLALHFTSTSNKALENGIFILHPRNKQS
jgi:hypothetical protein